MRSLRILGLVALVGLTANCGGGGGEGDHAVKGSLDLTLNTPNSDDGAVLFRVVGGDIDSVTAAAMTQEVSARIEDAYTRVVAAGNITDGIVVRIWVPDVNQASDYSVIMEQATMRTAPFTQRSIASYSIAVTDTP